MSLPNFSVRNSVLVNMTMILVIVMGTYSLITVPRELFPQVRLNRVFILVTYPGASPEDVEKLVTKPIEDEIQDVDLIDIVLSQSLEGLCRINVVFESTTESDFHRVYQDLRQEVDKVDLPEEAEDPDYFSLESSTWIPMASVVVSGDLPERRMKELAEELEDEIEALSGIDSVTITGIREREVWIEVDPDKIHRYNLTLEQVAQIIERQNVALPSGRIEVGDYEYLLRMCCNFQKAASERLVGSIRLRLMHPPRTAC